MEVSEAFNELSKKLLKQGADPETLKEYVACIVDMAEKPELRHIFELASKEVQKQCGMEGQYEVAKVIAALTEEMRKFW